MYQLTNILFAATIVGTTLAAPAPAPIENRDEHLFKRAPGSRITQFGNCVLPSSNVVVQTPSFPDPSYFSGFTAPGKITANSSQSSKYIKSILDPVPRWYASTFDTSKPNDGLKLSSQLRSPKGPDDISWVHNNIVFDWSDNGRGGFSWQRGGSGNNRVVVDRAWESVLLETFIQTQLDSIGRSSDGRSQYCSDFNSKILRNDMSQFKELFDNLPGLDQSRGIYHADFMGLDWYTNDLKGNIFGRWWDSRSNTRLDRSRSARELINIMERVVVAFDIFRDRFFVDIFERVNIRIHGIMIRIDTRIRVINERDRGVVRDNWADSFRDFIDQQLTLSERSAWDWFNRARVVLREQIDIEIRDGRSRGIFADNLNARYNRLAGRKQSDFLFNHDMAKL